MTQSIRLGIFVLVSLTILALFVFLVGSQESRFQSNYHLQAQFQSVSGLEEGADVRVGGFRKGTVRKIVLPKRPDGKITVQMDLAKDTQKIVKQDSLAAIKSEGLVGNKYVEVSFGSEGAPDVESWATIASEPPVDIADIVGKMNQILDSAKGAVENLQTASGNVNSITSKINSGRGTVGALINDKSIYQDATAGVSALRQDADALKHNFFLRGYFNKNGFADPADIQKHLISQIPAETPQKEFTYDGRQIFDKPDSAKLKNEKKLDEAGEYIESQKPALVVIEASMGPIGDADKDRQLSESRAFAVRGYLVDKFKVDDQRLKILGLGKSEQPAGIRIRIYSSIADRNAADRKKLGP